MASGNSFWGTSGGGSSGGSSSFWGKGGTVAAPAKAAGGGGLLGGIGHFFSQGGADLVSAAQKMPGGIVKIGEALGHDSNALFGHLPLATPHEKAAAAQPSALLPIAKAVATGYKQDFEHPLRHPGNDLLDLLGVASLGAGTAARLGLAGKALAAGEDASLASRLGAAGKALATKPPPVTRLISHDGLAVRLPAAANPLTRALQRGVDELRMRFPDVPLVGAARTVGKENLRGIRYQAQVAKAPIETMASYARQAGLLKRMGKVGPYTADALARQHALRVVAEGVPTAERVGFHQAQLERGFKSAAQNPALKAMRESTFVGGHSEQIGLNQAAAKYLDETGGVPKLTDPKLQRVYEQMVKVAGGREKVLDQIDALTQQAKTGRLSAPGRVLKGATFDKETGRLVGAEDFTGGQARVPTQPAFKSPRSTRIPPAVGSSGGIANLKAPGSLTHAYQGGAYLGGKVRNDVIRLMSESALEAQRYWTLLHVTDRLKAVAKDAPTGPHDIPIVTEKLPGAPSLRETIARLEDQKAAPGAVGTLSHGYEGLRSQLFPAFHRNELGQPEPVAAVPGVKYVDERLLGGLNKPNPLLGLSQHAGGKAFLSTVDAINNASKVAILYLKPAYVAPNLLSNVAANVVQQGFAAPVNLARAAKLWVKADPEVVKNVLASMGEGYAGSLDAQSGVAAKAAHFLAGKWAKPVDVLPRLASFLYEARRDGITSTADLKALFDDPARAAKLEQIQRRANAAAIDFGNLTPIEQSIIRRVIFFYPWVKGSAVWLGKFPVEHPLQAAAAVPLGRVGAQAQQQALGGQIPAWARTLIPTGATGPHGLPETFNPFTVTPFEVTGNLAQALGAALRGKVAQGVSLAENQTPASQFLTTGISKGLPEAATGLVSNLPPVVDVQQALGKGSKTYPYEGTPMSALLRYLIGTGFVPRETDQAALQKSAALERKRK